ncbi:MAG TPA: hypothetical protein VID47_12235 [Actinomycetota bacterium]|jgi:hypothetical protein
MARKRNWLGISLLVLSIVAWGLFAYFLVKTITSATSLTNCFSADCAGQGAEETTSYVPWVIGTAFAASILLTLAILAFRLRPVQGGPTSWDQVAQMGPAAITAAPQSWTSGATVPGYGPSVNQVTPTNFALPGAAPAYAPPATAAAPQASIVATRPVNASAAGVEMQVDMDVTVPGQAPRRVSKQMTVPPGGLARLYPGAVIPVTVNPANPDDVTLNLAT